MTPIPPKVKAAMEADPFYKVCALAGKWIELSFPIEGSMEFERRMTLHECDGRITWEHTLSYGNKQIQAIWAIIPICAKAHEVDSYQDHGTMDKKANIWVALNRATDEELFAISKVENYFRMREQLNKKYGVYVPFIPQGNKTVDKPVEKSCIGMGTTSA